MQGAHVQSLVGELRSRMPRGMAQKKKKETKLMLYVNYTWMKKKILKTSLKKKTSYKFTVIKTVW